MPRNYTDELKRLTVQAEGIIFQVPFRKDTSSLVGTLAGIFCQISRLEGIVLSQRYDTIEELLEKFGTANIGRTTVEEPIKDVEVARNDFEMTDDE